MPVFGVAKFERFFRAAAGLDVDKDDLKRYNEFVHHKVHDLLLIGQTTAEANNRDIIQPQDLPITKGLQECVHAFRKMDEDIELRPILEQLAGYPPLNLSLSEETEARLPLIIGGLSVALSRASESSTPKRETRRRNSGNAPFAPSICCCEVGRQMTDAAAMLNAYPAGLAGIDEDALIVCVQECLNCAHTAASCADACLAAPDPAELVGCIATALVCADVAETSARTVSRLTGRDTAVIRAVLGTCVEACRACYEECQKHALEHEHCRICAEACHRCAHACRQLLATLS